MQLNTHLRLRYLPLSKDQGNWLKGILIIIVLADHNNFLRQVSTDFFRPLTFHVIGFLLLNFYGSYFSHKSFRIFFIERSIRYLWPFFIFYFLYALVSNFANQITFTWKDYLLGMMIGSFTTVKQGCGGAFMWFLPALLSFSIFVKLISYLNLTAIFLLFILSTVLHIFMGDINELFKTLQPFGIGVSLYLAPISIIFFLIQFSIGMKIPYGSRYTILVLFIVAVVCHSILTMDRVNIEVGALWVPSSSEIGSIIVNIISNVVALLFLWMLAYKNYRPLSSFTQMIGKNSLFIYLVHPFLLAVYTQLINRLFSVNTIYFNIFFGVIAFAFILGLSMLGIFIMNKYTRLKSFIFPHDFCDLKHAIFHSK